MSNTADPVRVRYRYWYGTVILLTFPRLASLFNFRNLLPYSTTPNYFPIRIPYFTSHCNKSFEFHYNTLSTVPLFTLQFCTSPGMCAAHFVLFFFLVLLFASFQYGWSSEGTGTGTGAVLVRYGLFSYSLGVIAWSWLILILSGTKSSEGIILILAGRVRGGIHCSSFFLFFFDGTATGTVRYSLFSYSLGVRARKEFSIERGTKQGDP